ncbi:MAG: hypothetical protein HKN60_03755 [Rhizobiales bacterium]|nr:hypothetical protein [Hyphomicrobiales bacterium]
MATQPMTGPASAAWAGRAQVAFDEMLATSPPPEWVAARREREMRGRSGANWLLVASIALLMAGTATVAFVAAARNAGVDPSLGTVVAALNPPAATRPAPVVIVEPTLPKQDAQTAVTAQSQPAPKAAAQTPSAPAAVVPRVEIVDTRVIAPAIAAAIPALPAAPIPAPQAAPAPVVAELPSEPVRRSTLLLPTETRSSETPLVDHPQAAAAPQAPASVRVSPQAVEAAIVEASTREPRQAGATPPESPPEVRVASLNPGIELIRPGPASEAASSERSATAPSVNGLTHRAGLLLETGDVVAARMLFELAARGGDAAAAVGAGLTYDPVQFERLGVRGIQPDAELARAWYQRALDGGEKGALGEIERLEAWLAR